MGSRRIPLSRKCDTEEEENCTAVSAAVNSQTQRSSCGSASISWLNKSGIVAPLTSSKGSCFSRSEIPRAKQDSSREPMQEASLVNNTHSETTSAGLFCFADDAPPDSRKMMIIHRNSSSHGDGVPGDESEMHSGLNCSTLRTSTHRNILEGEVRSIDRSDTRFTHTRLPTDKHKHMPFREEAEQQLQQQVDAPFVSLSAGRGDGNCLWSSDTEKTESKTSLFFNAVTVEKTEENHLCDACEAPEDSLVLTHSGRLDSAATNVNTSPPLAAENGSCSKNSSSSSSGCQSSRCRTDLPRISSNCSSDHVNNSNNGEEAGGGFSPENLNAFSRLYFSCSASAAVEGDSHHNCRQQGRGRESGKVEQQNFTTEEESYCSELVQSEKQQGDDPAVKDVVRWLQQRRRQIAAAVADDVEEEQKYHRVYTYELLDGVCTDSNALQTGKEVGMPLSLLSRARELQATLQFSTLTNSLAAQRKVFKARGKGVVPYSAETKGLCSRDGAVRDWNQIPDRQPGHPEPEAETTPSHIQYRGSMHPGSDARKGVEQAYSFINRPSGEVNFCSNAGTQHSGASTDSRAGLHTFCCNCGTTQRSSPSTPLQSCSRILHGEGAGFMPHRSAEIVKMADSLSARHSEQRCSSADKSTSENGTYHSSHASKNVQLENSANGGSCGSPVPTLQGGPNAGRVESSPGASCGQQNQKSHRDVHQRSWTGALQYPGGGNVLRRSALQGQQEEGIRVNHLQCCDGPHAQNSLESHYTGKPDKGTSEGYIVAQRRAIVVAGDCGRNAPDAQGLDKRNNVVLSDKNASVPHSRGNAEQTHGESVASVDAASTAGKTHEIGETNQLSTTGMEVRNKESRVDTLVGEVAAYQPATCSFGDTIDPGVMQDRQGIKGNSGVHEEISNEGGGDSCARDAVTNSFFSTRPTNDGSCFSITRHVPTDTNRDTANTRSRVFPSVRTTPAASHSSVATFLSSAAVSQKLLLRLEEVLVRTADRVDVQQPDVLLFKESCYSDAAIAEGTREKKSQTRKSPVTDASRSKEKRAVLKLPALSQRLMPPPLWCDGVPCVYILVAPSQRSQNDSSPLSSPHPLHAKASLFSGRGTSAESQICRRAPLGDELPSLEPGVRRQSITTTNGHNGEEVGVDRVLNTSSFLCQSTTGHEGRNCGDMLTLESVVSPSASCPRSSYFNCSSLTLPSPHCVYVGETQRLHRRLRVHARKEQWAHARVLAVRVSSKGVAQDVEAAVITQLREEEGVLLRSLKDGNRKVGQKTAANIARAICNARNDHEEV